jgi:hypothetical protein
MFWGRLCSGFLLGAVGGTVLGYAVCGAGLILWPIGILTLLLGGLTTVSALVRPRHAELDPGPEPGWDATKAPRLGQMLVSYGLISEADLDRALARQEKSGRRLGQVMVEMKLVTHAQLAEVLEEQLSRREGRLLWGAGGRLLS